MPAIWRTPVRLLAGAICAVVMSSAAPPLTIIQDVLYKANGRRFDGIAQISWKSFRAADGTEIPQQTLNVRVNNGNLRVMLVPTTNALDAATYTVKYNSDGHTQFTEYWAVAPSASALKLRDVRTGPPAPGQLEESGPVTIATVPGLRTELDLRPARGASYAPSRTAVINSVGAIDAALGDLTFCVRVDGTAAPCNSVIFVDGEVPTGTINGTNAAFTLGATPTPAASLMVFRNGILQKAGVDFILIGNTITFTPVSIPLAGDLLQASYRR